MYNFKELIAQKTTNYVYRMTIEATVYASLQSELPPPIARNSVESDQGCTSRIYFDKVGDNVTLTLYNVKLTSKNPCL